MIKHLIATLLITTMGTTAAYAAPSYMIQPDGAVILSGGVGSGSIVDTYNQAGLSVGYVSGVTLTQPYLSIADHTNIFAGYEWFSDFGTTAATVSYHVTLPRGLSYINSFELWNEESSGIGQFDLWWGSFAGDTSLLLLSGVSPTDNPLGPNYFADVYGIAPTKGGWYTLVGSGCPQADPGSYPSCAIGEVAFNGSAVPEPASWALMLGGFGLVGYSLRRRQVKHVSA